MKGVFLNKHCIKKQMIGISLVLICSMSLIGCFDEQKKTNEFFSTTIEQNQLEEKEEIQDNLSGASSSIQEQEICFVYLCGAVKNPDVYAVKNGARIYEVVKKAGGFSKDADQTAINLAELVFDGQQIYIPTKEEIGERILNSKEQSLDNTGKINLNTATKEQLMTLPGVGGAKADAILEYREEHGKFRNIEELKEIRGIKDRIFQKMQDKIIVN